jgi:hypothetical protein
MVIRKIKLMQHASLWNKSSVLRMVGLFCKVGNASTKIWLSSSKTHFLCMKKRNKIN